MIETKPTTPASTRPDEEAVTREGFAAYVRTEYDRRLRERRPFEQQWLLNLAFIEGNHYAEINRATGEIFVPERAYIWEQRDAFNHIAPVYETRVAKIQRNRPVMSVRPGSPDEEDLAAAKVAKKLLDYNQDEQHLPGLIADAIAWTEAVGTVFIKNLWNPSRGSRLPDPTRPQGEFGYPAEFAMGDIESVVCSPFEIFPDTILKPRLEQQRSLIHAKAWPVNSDHIEALKAVFNQETGEELSVVADDVTAVTLGRGTTTINGLPDLRFAVQGLRNHVVVLEYYERPCARYPRGRFAIVVGNSLAYYGDLPYKLDLDFPFAKVDAIRRPNCFWSKSVTERLIPVQRRYNALRNRITEYLNRVGMGQWTVEEGTTDIDNLTNEPGLVLEHTRGSRPPSPVQFPSLPSTFTEELSTLRQEFMDISGLHEVSHAQIPRGAGSSPSGVLIAQLQEQDDTRLSSTQRYLDEAMERMGKQWLLRYKEFVREKRSFPVMGRNGTLNMMWFDANTIRSYNVKVEASSALANSPAARREMIFALLDRGLFNDPETGKLSPHGLQKVFEMLEFGNWEEVEEDKALPQNRAQWENHMITMGKEMPVYRWEDHLQHMAIHNRFRQTEEFYSLLEGQEGPMAEQLMDAHVQQHEQFLQELMAPPPQPQPPAQAPAPDPTQAPMQPPEQVPPEMMQLTGPGALPGPLPGAGDAPPPIGGPTAPLTGNVDAAPNADMMSQLAQQATMLEKLQGPDAADAFVKKMMSQSGGATGIPLR